MSGEVGDTSAPAPEDLKVDIDDDGPSSSSNAPAALPEPSADASAGAPGKDEPPKPLFVSGAFRAGSSVVSGFSRGQWRGRDGSCYVAT